MIIETKFNVGDYAFFIYKNEIITRKVSFLEIEIHETYRNIQYHFIIDERNNFDDINYHICDEEKCFYSINELSEYYATNLSKKNQ